ncbi:MAG: LysR family transcriptional regulator [Lachnospiraceae bacterium]|nr:LysR family transcriptional regulator [Lachnospiraceae bacterium]
MNISCDYYKIFYYVAKHKSFTEAARVLLNNQPNLTRTIKKLEDELGCTLFIRQRHGVTLTPEGEKLYAHISIAFEHILRGEQEIARDKSLQSGIITIAASEIALHCTLLPILKKFRNSYPGIHIKILNHSTPQAIEVLKNGLADFAIVTEPFEPSTDISSKILRSIQEVPVCSNTLLPSMGTCLTYEQMKQYPWIGLGKKTSSFAFYSDFFNKMNLPFSPDVEAATADQILPMIKSDLGIGFVPTDFLENENMEHLMILNMETPIPERNICILKRKNTSLSIAASELENLIRQNHKREQVKE